MSVKNRYLGFAALLTLGAIGLSLKGWHYLGGILLGMATLAVLVPFLSLEFWNRLHPLGWFVVFGVGVTLLALSWLPFNDPTWQLLYGFSLVVGINGAVVGGAALFFLVAGRLSDLWNRARK